MSSRQAADITKLFTMSASDLLDEWFESTELKALIATNGVIGTWAGPEDARYRIRLLHHVSATSATANLAEWGYPSAGWGLFAALRRSAERFGAEVHVNAPVDRILVENGAALGAVTASGDEYQGSDRDQCLPPKDHFSQADRTHAAASRLRARHRELPHS